MALLLLRGVEMCMSGMRNLLAISVAIGPWARCPQHLCGILLCTNVWGGGFCNSCPSQPVGALRACGQMVLLWTVYYVVQLTELTGCL